jgi:hypothetical protein
MVMLRPRQSCGQQRYAPNPACRNPVEPGRLCAACEALKNANKGAN